MRRRSISSASRRGSTRSCRARARSSARCARRSMPSRRGRSSTASSGRRSPSASAFARETAIGESPASVSSAAAALAAQVFGELAGRRVLLIGAGRIGELAASNLASRGAEIAFVANRTANAARELAQRFGGRAIAPRRGGGAARPTSTSSSRRRARPRPCCARTRSPRAAGGRCSSSTSPCRATSTRRSPRLDGCFLYDIDDLEAVVAETLSGRRAEAARAEQLVAEEAARFRSWRASLDVVPAIASLRARAEEIRSAELAKVDGRVSDAERRTLESVTAADPEQAPAPADGAHEGGRGQRRRRRVRRRRAPPVRARGRADVMSADDDRRIERPLPVVAPSAFLRVRRRHVRVRADASRREVGLCSFASGLAALGSRSPRPSRRRPRCAGPASRSRSSRSRRPATATARRPFGQIGERGVFVKELEEALLARPHRRRRALGEGHDLDRHRGARRRRLPRARRPARRARRRDGDRPGMRIGTASARRRAQLLALEPTLSVEPMRGNVDTRLRKLRERGLDAIVLAACGLDRLGLADEIGCALDPEHDAAGGGAGRARAAGARGRGGARRACRRRRDASARRARAACVARIGAGCLAPVAAHHDGVDAARARSRTRTARGSSGARATIPPRSRQSSSRCGDYGAARMQRDRHAAAGAGRPARRAARGARRRRRRVPADRDRADRRTSRSTPPGYDWVVVTSPNGADEVARRGDEPAARRRRRPGHGRGAARARDRARVRAARVVAGRAAARVPAAGGPRAVRRGRGRAPRADRRARRRLRAALPDAAAHAGAARRATSSCSPPARPRGRTPASAAPRAGGVDRAADDAHRASPSASTVAAEAATHDLDGLVAAVRGFDELARDDRRHLPHRLRPRRTTSSAPATA